MRKTLRFSILLNLVLLGSLIFALKNQRHKESHAAPILSEARPTAQAAVPIASVPSDLEPAPFRWSQLRSGKDYRAYIANLRAVGCPEATVEDIVRGDTDRAFVWERNQLGLGESGNGPWSRSQEMQLVANLLSSQAATESAALAQDTKNPTEENNGSEVAPASVPSQSTGTGPSHYPLFLQNVNWGAFGFTASQQAAIAQVRQQYLSQMDRPNQNPNDAPDQDPGSANQNSSPTDQNNSPANPNFEDQLRALLGAQGYMAYEQLQYWYWYQPQIAAGQLSINPAAFSLK